MIPVDAKHVHRRGQTHAKAVKAGQDDHAVPVRFDPENPPSQEFKDFYPLHVTKVAETKHTGSMTNILGVVVLVMVAAAVVLYILAQQAGN